MNVKNDCECLFRRPHPTLSAEVCLDCGRKHYVLKAGAGKYFAKVDPAELPRDKWSAN